MPGHLLWNLLLCIQMGGVGGIRSSCALIVGNESTGFVPSAFVDSLLSGSVAAVAVAAIVVVVLSRALRACFPSGSSEVQ